MKNHSDVLKNRIQILAFGRYHRELTRKRIRSKNEKKRQQTDNQQR